MSSCVSCARVALADTLDSGGRGHELQNLRREEIVVQDHIGLPQNSQGFQREQFRIAGPAPMR